MTSNREDGVAKQPRRGRNEESALSMQDRALVRSEVLSRCIGTD